MRRGVGIGAIQKKKDAESKFKAKSHELAGEQIAQLSSNLDQFRDLLESFAGKHRNEIRKNPEFRRQFQEMCAAIGVDPLASSKGFWAEKLGVGEFYYELGVQIVEICIATNHLNGGLISLDELLQRLLRSRSKKRKEDIAKDDILRAIEKLHVLGSGFSVIRLGSRVLVQSVPGELNMDHSRILNIAEKTGYVSVQSVASELNWECDRAQRNLDDLVKDGLVWIDSEGPGEDVLYWFPTFFNQLASA